MRTTRHTLTNGRWTPDPRRIHPAMRGIGSGQRIRSIGATSPYTDRRDVAKRGEW